MLVERGVVYRSPGLRRRTYVLTFDREAISLALGFNTPGEVVEHLNPDGELARQREREHGLAVPSPR